MTFVQKMFSFEGRLHRQDFWIMTLILWGVNLAVLMLLFSVTMGPLIGMGVAAERAGRELDDAEALAAIAPFFWVIGLALLFQLAMLWPTCAVQAKRFHDRDQSGWLVLILVFCRMVSWIPIVGILPGLGGFLFWLINLGILEGTPGPNRYGQSPKPEFGPAEAFA